MPKSWRFSASPLVVCSSRGPRHRLTSVCSSRRVPPERYRPAPPFGAGATAVCQEVPSLRPPFGGTSAAVAGGPAAAETQSVRWLTDIRQSAKRYGVELPSWPRCVPRQDGFVSSSAAAWPDGALRPGRRPASRSPARHRIHGAHEHFGNGEPRASCATPHGGVTPPNQRLLLAGAPTAGGPLVAVPHW